MKMKMKMKMMMMMKVKMKMKMMKMMNEEEEEEEEGNGFLQTKYFELLLPKKREIGKKKKKNHEGKIENNEQIFV
jgi:hypothetical protein